MTFDLSKITGNEPPLQTENDKDAEIERLRAELARANSNVEIKDALARGRQQALERLSSELKQAQRELWVAAGMLSTYPPFASKNPQDALDYIKAAAQEAKE